MADERAVGDDSDDKEGPEVKDSGDVEKEREAGGGSAPDSEGDGKPAADNDDVTLQTQHTDKDLAHMIDYLQHGILPDDNKTARRVLLTKDNFAIRDGKLIHLGVKRQKNNGTEQPIAEQLCVPKQRQPTLLATITRS